MSARLHSCVACVNVCACVGVSHMIIITRLEKNDMQRIPIVKMGCVRRKRRPRCYEDNLHTTSASSLPTAAQHWTSKPPQWATAPMPELRIDPILDCNANIGASHSRM